MQWHPHFAKLLRPLLEGYFDVQINVPVGDAPREADLVLVRRTAPGKLPYHGLWKYLTTWNVLEYKGPTVTARIGDLDLLFELGLGIHRRLREKRTVPSATEPADVSFWYLAHHLGRRFLGHAKEYLGSLETVAPGIWRCRILQRLVFLVSGGNLPVEPDTLPFHILEPGSAENEQAVARLLIQRPSLAPTLADWLLNLHPALLREVENMAKSKQLNMSVKPVLQFLGVKEVLRQLSEDPELHEDDWIRYYLAKLPEKKRKAMMKRMLEEFKV